MTSWCGHEVQTDIRHENNISGEVEIVFGCILLLIHDGVKCNAKGDQKAAVK
jgi:hypothetical protein